MALRRALSKPLSLAAKLDSPSPIRTAAASPNPPPSQSYAIRSQFHRGGFFRRFLQRRGINHHSSALPSGILSFPVGERLREKLKFMNMAGEHCLRPDEFNPSSSHAPAEESGFTIGAADVKKVLRLVKIEEIRERLRSIPANTIPYSEFISVCSDACGDTKTALELAKSLDDSGNVIVLGHVVFLRPHQVAKSMEKFVSQSIATPNDPRRKELETLQYEKAFWELSWDVMEPICFFATSLHFALAYAFFLRTSKEPSFEGFFQGRFKIKQTKLMKIRNFDVHRYNKLCEAFYRNHQTDN